MPDDIIDLDARRAARTEASGGDKKIRLGGEVFTVAPELSMTFAEHLVSGRFRQAYAVLVGEDDAERFASVNPTNEDINEIAKAVYGMSLPESSPSTRSSMNGGTKPRRTSRATTRSR